MNRLILKCYEATISSKIDLPYFLDLLWERNPNRFIGNGPKESPAKIANTISILKAGKPIESLVAYPSIHENGEIRFKVTQGGTRYVLLKIFENMAFKILIIDSLNIGIDKIRTVFPDVKECYDYLRAELEYSPGRNAHKFNVIYGDKTPGQRFMGLVQDMEEQYSEWLKTKPVLKFYHNNKLKYKWGIHESNGVIIHHTDNVVDSYKILLKHLDII